MLSERKQQHTCVKGRRGQAAGAAPAREEAERARGDRERGREREREASKQAKKT